jgi:hypothetical protein
MRGRRSDVEGAFRAFRAAWGLPEYGAGEPDLLPPPIGAALLVQRGAHWSLALAIPRGVTVLAGPLPRHQLVTVLRALAAWGRYAAER